MDKSSAKKLIKETFEKPFFKQQFTLFIKNLLNHIEETPQTNYYGNLVPDAYKPYINHLSRIGKYTGPDDKKLDVLVINLKKETSLERARTMQRNFIAWYLNGSRGDILKDAALVAFVSPDQEDWRFSYVKMEYRFDTSGETPKVKQEFTPARRYSFLVGQNENSHTAQIQLFPILCDEAHDPTLAELEEAFSIEKVTKEFFEKYRELYLKLKESLDDIVAKDAKIKADFTKNGVDTVDFVKKLLGQIVFLYFLQKKGWFGVGRDADWGTGPKDFLRRLFEKKHGDYNNFFNDILEPLFYNTLALERPFDYADRFDCKIPFLNGGLFDPLNNYDWVHTDIIIPDKLFSNHEPTKEGDIGTGILDIFDRYNFTVKEDEPLEKEVAVDPEMLGKVFENLLEVRDRKSKGTYYTPREIVHYMCQESLINYLATELAGKVDKADLETLIKYGETAVEHDTHVEIKGKETERYSYKLPESIRRHAREIDQKLAAIRVCDPAIGSGAFPVGMMHEIVQARNVLTAYLPDKAGRSVYNFKRHAIQECLYGVDIDPGAAEIAKLRLWLSLVVDEEDIKQIKPLPNLDYKIVCGNSLLSVEKNLINYQLFKQLEEIKARYFEETSPSKKQHEKAQIDALIAQITNGHQEFDFEVYFSEVFHEKGGFDVVIANPPYVSHDKIKGKKNLKNQFKSFEPFADLYCYFIELALKIQNSRGLLCFITSNSYLRAAYGRYLRNLLRGQNNILGVINIEDFQVFNTAIVNTAIIISQSKRCNRNLNCLTVNSVYSGNITFEQFIEQNKFYYIQEDFLNDPWGLISPENLKLKKKIEAGGKSLALYGTKIRLGVATGANDVFIIDKKKRDYLIEKDPKNSEIIKPILRGRDIFRYKYQFNNFFIILTQDGIDVCQKYPTIYDYLDSCGEKFKNRGAKGRHWSNLRPCSFLDDFKQEKIIWIELSDKGRFTLCNDEVYLLNTAYFLLPPKIFLPKYLLAVLNSIIIEYYLNLTAATSGMGTNRWINNYVKDFPVPEIDQNKQNVIASVVDKILTITETDDYLKNPAEQAQVKEYERQIDQMVYKLYDLTPEEIEVVENFNKKL